MLAKQPEELIHLPQEQAGVQPSPEKPGSIMSNSHLGRQMSSPSFLLPQVYMLSMMSWYGISLWSAVLAVSPPESLCTPSPGGVTS